MSDSTDTMDIVVGTKVRVRGITQGRPPHGEVIRVYANGEFSVKLTGRYLGEKLRVTADRLTVL